MGDFNGKLGNGSYKDIVGRARSKVRKEISEEKYGFMDERGTRNAIFVMRLMAERAIEMQKDL